MIARLRQFREERDWVEIHNLKDLAAAISIEAAELQEIFLWRPESSGTEIAGIKRAALADEIADVIIQCLNFADVAGIDVLDAVEKKIAVNEVRYPIEKARGSPQKYTEFSD